MSGEKIIKPLHGLRGIAAMTVVIGHFLQGGTPALGVVLFFVLSGFLIGRLYLEQAFTPANVWRYAVARIARVYPLFAVVIVGTACLNALASANIFGLAPGQVPRHLGLAGSARTVWTISTEFQFYGLFVLVWALRSRFPAAPTTIVPLLLGATAMMVWLGTDAGRTDIRGYLHIFALGLFVAILTARDREGWQGAAARAIPVLAAAYLAAFLLVPLVHAPRWVYMDPVAVGICAALLAATVLGGNCFANRLISRPLFVWLGEVSFGVYLLHRHAEWLVDAVAGEASPWLTLPLKIALALLLAQLANRLIERPFRSWLRQAGGRVTPKVAGSVTG